MIRLSRRFMACCIACSMACTGRGSGGAPALDPLFDQAVEVGHELVMLMVAADPEGDTVAYAFESNMPGLEGRAEIVARVDGTGVFKFRPIARDVGRWAFDFSAGDGNASALETIEIEVRPELAQRTLGAFSAPIGSGMSFDLAASPCVELDVKVEDSDSPRVTIDQIPPLIEGASLEQTGSFSARWKWCPTERQAEASSQEILMLSASSAATDDVVTKTYVLLNRSNPSNRSRSTRICEGGGPIISHRPVDQVSEGDLIVRAEISSDLGLDGVPTLYTTTLPPGSTPDLGSMIAWSMALEEGTRTHGTWSARIPNPTADLVAGSKVAMYYAIVARVHADTQSGLGSGSGGPCEHVSQAPPVGGGAYKMTATAGGASACVDDASEDDDDADSATPVALGDGGFRAIGRALCPFEQDWFRIDLYSGQTVSVDLDFNHAAGDLDLRFLDRALLDHCNFQCVTTTNHENFELAVTEPCAPCTFFVVVGGHGGAENDYDLRIGLLAE